MDAARLADELARRMRAVVPPRIHIAVEGDMLRFTSSFHSESGGSGTYACRRLSEGVGEEEHLIAGACWQALNDLQDYVAEESTDPWPTTGAGTMPDAAARIQDGKVLLWFGDMDAPVLRLESLPLNL